MKFKKGDSHDLKKQLEYLNNKSEHQEDKLTIAKEQHKRFDFSNKSKIIEFKKRNCSHDQFPNFILQEDKLRTNMEIAKKHNIKFYYQNRFSDNKVWEWDITKMVENNLLPEPIVKKMNDYTYVNNQQKVPKKAYMLTLAMGYEI